MISLGSCPICSSATKPWATSDGYSIRRCTGCGFAFVDPRPDRAEIAERYRSMGGHCGSGARTMAEALIREKFFPNTTVDARRVVAALQDLTRRRGGRLLDVGCGYGFFSSEALRLGFEVTALEIAPTERQIAAELLGVEPSPAEFEDFDDGRLYDAVVMSQVLEHAVDVNEWVGKAHRLTMPGGVLAVALPNFSSLLRLLLRVRDPYISPPAHLNYFSAANLGLLLEKHGFEVLRSETVSRVPYDALGKRLKGGGKGVAWVLTQLVKQGQKPVAAAVDHLGRGIFLNVYARHSADDAALVQQER